MSTLRSPRRRFAHTKVYDLVAAAPLIALYGIAGAGLLIEVREEGAGLARSIDVPVALRIAGRLATLLFFGLQMILFVIRRVPEGKSRGVLPRLVAIVGGSSGIAFLTVPRAENSVAVTVVSTVLVLVGTVGSIYVACWLGRCFSVFPEARGMVANGPYRHIRHPLYLAEQVAILGVMLQFARPWSVLVAAAIFAVLLARMHFEEQVLGDTFAAYRDYVRRTWRLIPGIY